MEFEHSQRDNLPMAEVETPPSPISIQPGVSLGVSISPSPLGDFFGDTAYRTANYLCQGWPLAYLIATVIFGIGLLIGSHIYVSQPAQVAQQSAPLPSPFGRGAGGEGRGDADSPLPSKVGRITGMVGCQFVEGSGFRVQGSGAGGENSELPSPAGRGAGGEGSSDGLHPSSFIPHPSSPVSLGDKFALASGLMEITYDTGAKVILQGPVTYEVESPHGGFLSLGKLTARLEKKGEGGRRKAEESNPQSPIPNLASLSTIHDPLFTIRTPTATVTDLGTEFGVEVKQNQTTEVTVFRGVVETVRLASGVVAGERRRVVAGQSVRCEPRHKAIAMVAFRPETFEQSLQLTEDSGEFTGLRLGKRWTFDTCNAGNKWSLAARPGFLRMKLYNACQISWEDRGTAPILYTALPSPPDRFSMETYVDLATGNGGKPRHRTIGGLAVYDAARDDFVLDLGLLYAFSSKDDRSLSQPCPRSSLRESAETPRANSREYDFRILATGPQRRGLDGILQGQSGRRVDSGGQGDRSGLFARTARRSSHRSVCQELRSHQPGRPGREYRLRLLPRSESR